MNKWDYLIEALQKGVRLAEVESWKNTQLISTLIVGIVVAVYGFAAASGLLPPGLPVTALAESITAAGFVIWSTISAYITVATTKKLGLKGGKKPVAPNPKLAISEDV